jgi:hypothetical protein
MAMRHHLERILGAAIVLIALLAAPTVVSAHTGHIHAVPANHAVTSESSDAVSVQTIAKVSPAELRNSTGSHSPSSGGSGCHGEGCCSGTPCTACCAVTVPSGAATEPPTSSAPLIHSDSRANGGLDPDGLRRPPRFFA